MKHLKQLAAGITGAVILLQNAGIIPLLPAAPALSAPVLNASAASVQVNKPRTFDYNFSGFEAQYDPLTDQWFTKNDRDIPDGRLIRSETKAVQELTAGDDSSIKLILNFTEQTASVSKNGTATDCSELFRELLFEPLAGLKPEYETGRFFDKATQQYYERPEPKSFPLTFICDPQFRNSAPASLTCSIRFGNYEFSTLGISMQGDMFSGTANGSVRIRTAAALQAKAVVTPGACAGDANADRKVDVSDAVLVTRIAAEDVKARISDIGMVLADQNCDRHIDGSDINDIIYDIARIPYENRVPAGTIPVISAEMCSLADFEAVFGADAKQTFGEMTYREAGEQYDKWYFAISRPSDTADSQYRANQFNLTSLTLDENGYLQIEAAVANSLHTGFMMIAVTVPHNKLPADTVGAINLDYVQVLPPFSPQIRYIPVKKPPETSVQILSVEQPAPERTAADWAALAQALGYTDGNDLTRSIRAENSRNACRQHCTEGEQYDVWDIACFLDDPYIGSLLKDANLEKLNLYQDDGILHGIIGMYMQAEEPVRAEDPCVWFWFRLKVRHGALPADTKAKLMPEERHLLNQIPAVRYIGVYSKNTGKEMPGIPCWQYSYSGLRDIVNYAPKEIRDELDVPGTWYTCRTYTDTEKMPESEQNVWNLYTRSLEPPLLFQFDHFPAENSQLYDFLCVYFKTPADENGGYFSEYSIENAELKDGVLTLKAAEYRPLAQKDIPEHYDRLLIEMPNNLLKYVDDIRVEKVPYYDEIQQFSSAEQPECNAVRGDDGLWHWEQEINKRESFLAAGRNGLFSITGDIPEESYTISAKVSISVADYVTKKPLPDCGLRLMKEHVTLNPSDSETDLYQTWTTTESEPVTTLTLEAKRYNYGWHPEEPDYQVCITDVPLMNTPYRLPVSEQLFRLPDDGSDLNIVLYVLRIDREPNVRFTFRDWSSSTNTQHFFSEIAAGSELTVCDSEGRELYFSIPYEHFDCMLPDGTYTAKLQIGDCDYTAAFPEILAQKGFFTEEELSQISDPEGITFTVKDGIPDAPEYCFDLMLKEEFDLRYE